MSVRSALQGVLPTPVCDTLSRLRSRFKRARILKPYGSLIPGSANRTFIMAVGSSFDQERPDAMMTCRMGYCHAFELLGIPYVVADIRDVLDVSREVPNPFCMFFAGDMHLIARRVASRLRGIPSAVWVYPWFRDSDQFFRLHALDPGPWALPQVVRSNILALQPRFVFTATVPSGLGFFEEWGKQGLEVVSLPLACDTTMYRRESPDYREFEGLGLAFVGGYWQSKGRQIDRYLRPLEDRLVIYGYSRWPYSGYRGLLPRNAESSLYRQARVSPTINEPTVALLKGQINERVFKVLGSYGCTVVDAVPAYRELYSDGELLVSESPEHFYELVVRLLNDDDLRSKYRDEGYRATLQRHTYVHRATEYLNRLQVNVEDLANNPST
jgi:glycosyltransferase involved in cell wall biosynthesis